MFYKQIIENAARNLTAEQVISFARRNNTELTSKQVQFILSFVKSNYQLIFTDQEAIFRKLKEEAPILDYPIYYQLLMTLKKMAGGFVQ